ncbi:MAG: hypothetical protein ACP5JT_01800 [Thermoplasmata archaeon]|jgi:archaellum component FlaC
MFSKKKTDEEIDLLKDSINKLSKDVQDLKVKQDEISKILTELENKIAFLNVLSAKINTTYYHITYDMDDKLKNFLSEIKENLESILNQMDEKLNALAEKKQEVQEPAPSAPVSGRRKKQQQQQQQ